MSDSDVNGGNGAMSASGCSDYLSLGQKRVDDVVSVIFVQGSSPHARGRLLAQVAGMNWERITPACARKTEGVAERAEGAEDHPRMRGEDSTLNQVIDIPPGSPPHARGRREEISEACNRNTDHPRMRGEDTSKPAEVA